MIKEVGANENRKSELISIAIAIVLGLLAALVATRAYANDELDKQKAEVMSHVATSFDPGPSLVMKVLRKIRLYRQVDLGLNLTAFTTYGVGDVLFPGGYEFSSEYSTSEQKYKSLAQRGILRDIRHYFANPENLSAVYGQVKAVATPALLQKVGASRANTWLSPAEDLFTKGGFKPALGKSYEDWRFNGCQWYLQVDPDPGYKPALSKNECVKHPFVKAVGPTKDAGAFVNRAHWYGFLWRRYLEGDTGLVTVWQGILSDITKAARSQS